MHAPQNQRVLSLAEFRAFSIIFHFVFSVLVQLVYGCQQDSCPQTQFSGESVKDAIMEGGGGFILTLRMLSRM